MEGGRERALSRNKQIRASGGEGEDGEPLEAEAGTLGSDHTVGLHSAVSSFPPDAPWYYFSPETKCHFFSLSDISIVVFPQKKSITYEEIERDEQKSKITRAVFVFSLSSMTSPYVLN